MNGLCRKRKLKGQLIFEFMIAVVIFFGIVLYVLNYLNGSVAGYSTDFASENMQSKSNQIAELLVLNEGRWPGGNPAIAGLAEDWPVLNSTKISWLDASCNGDYWTFKNGMGISNNKGLKIVISRPGAVLADCPVGTSVPSNVTRADAKRYALSESGDVLTVSVFVWCTGNPCSN